MPTLEKALHKLLAEKRDNSLGSASVIRQTEVAKDAGISQPQLSRIERGGAELNSLRPKQVLAILQGYHFSREEILELAETYDLDLPYEYKHEEALRFGSRATTEGPKARHYGSISAGLNPTRSITSGQLVSIPQWIADRYNQEEIFVVTVEGDSMACDDVREDIPPATECYFHSKLRPETNDVIACWLEASEIGVLKIYRPGPDFVVLQSYNKQHKPIIIDERNPGRIQGVLVGTSKPQPRFRNGR